jgi:hypothetical protein
MTKNEMIEQLKAEYPTLRIGDEDSGYTELDAERYEATIQEWADNLIALEEVKQSREASKKAAEDKLAALGLTPDDLKALGL